MSKPRPWYSCRNKIRHATEPQANDVVEPYACELCGGWHMRRKKKGGSI